MKDVKARGSLNLAPKFQKAAESRHVWKVRLPATRLSKTMDETGKVKPTLP